MAIEINTPVSGKIIRSLRPGDQISISGAIFTGRDASLPRLVGLVQENRLNLYPIDLQGGIIFHSAVSLSGIGPTTSSKLEIESSIPTLSRAGIRIHIGKGAISPQTVESLNQFESIFAITPPASALLTMTIVSKKLIAFPGEGMEAMYELMVRDFPAIVAVSGYGSIFNLYNPK